MRRLIRPTLFALARLGLFMSIASCATWPIEYLSEQRMSFDYYLFDYRIWVQFYSDSWAVEYDSDPIPPTTGSFTTGPVRIWWDDFGGRFESDRNGFYLAVEHWVSLVLAALFYASLKFIYRRREPSKDGEPCED